MGPGGQAALVVWVWGDRQIALAWPHCSQKKLQSGQVHSEVFPLYTDRLIFPLDD